MESECVLPQKGHYANKNGKEASCKVITNKQAWLATPTEGLAEDKCPFTCKVYHVKDESKRACNPPKKGQYIDDSGIAHQCTGVIQNSNVIGGQAVAVSASGECPFTCLAGYVKTESGRSCTLPPYFFIAADSTAKSCGTVPASSTGWVSDQANLNVRQKSDCVFTCAAGRTASGTGSSESCDLNVGHYPTTSTANSAGASCGVFPASSIGWADDQSNVHQAQDCKLKCASGRIVSGAGSSGSCVLDVGHFASSDDTNSEGIACGVLPAGAIWLDLSGVRRAADCVFQCIWQKTNSVQRGNVRAQRDYTL